MQHNGGIDGPNVVRLEAHISWQRHYTVGSMSQRRPGEARRRRYECLHSNRASGQTRASLHSDGRCAVACAYVTLGNNANASSSTGTNSTCNFNNTHSCPFHGRKKRPISSERGPPRGRELPVKQATCRSRRRPRWTASCSTSARSEKLRVGAMIAVQN
jgi:hypothetical protein